MVFLGLGNEGKNIRACQLWTIDNFGALPTQVTFLNSILK